MFCENCEGDNKWIMMEAMGYGDEVCPVCGHIQYADHNDEDAEENYEH